MVLPTCPLIWQQRPCPCAGWIHRRAALRSDVHVTGSYPANVDYSGAILASELCCHCAGSYPSSYACGETLASVLPSSKVSPWQTFACACRIHSPEREVTSPPDGPRQRVHLTIVRGVQLRSTIMRWCQSLCTMPWRRLVLPGHSNGRRSTDISSIVYSPLRL